jgi:hypothetical protein
MWKKISKFSRILFDFLFGVAIGLAALEGYLVGLVYPKFYYKSLGLGVFSFGFTA